MEKRVQLFGLAILVTAGMMFSSCGNIDIVKRKYRPGFHVDITKKNKKQNDSKENATVEKRQRTINTFEQESATATVNEPKEETLEPVFGQTASASLQTEPQVERSKGKQKIAKTINNLIAKPFRELKREKMGREIRRAIFDLPEKDGWSVVAIMSTGFAFLALVAFIAFIFFLAAGLGLSWGFGIAAMVFAITALVMGIIGLKQTGSGEKRGKGFALAGMIGGSVLIALSLIIPLIILLFWLLLNSG